MQVILTKKNESIFPASQAPRQIYSRNTGEMLVTISFGLTNNGSPLLDSALGSAVLTSLTPGFPKVPARLGEA